MLFHVSQHTMTLYESTLGFIHMTYVRLYLLRRLQRLRMLLCLLRLPPLRLQRLRLLLRS